jgi:hypothetical protein
MPVSVVTVDGWLCTVMSGSGLRPPGDSSVEPNGIPTRPTVDCAPRPVGEEAEAVALDDVAAVPLAQVPEAFPDMPVESNSGVGAGVPDVMAPLVVMAFGVVDVTMPDVPGMEVVGCAMAPIPEQAVEAVIEPSAVVPATLALTPGVAISVAPSGIPVGPTGEPGPSPSGEVTPSGAGAPVIMPTCAKAGPQPNTAQATAVIRNGLMSKLPEVNCSITPPADPEAP